MKQEVFEALELLERRFSSDKIVRQALPNSAVPWQDFTGIERIFHARLTPWLARQSN
jgi:hypothetical protein